VLRHRAISLAQLLIACLPLSGVVEEAIVLPAVEVAVLVASGSGEDENV
jgi:hypothetical protein